jgi:hypothetical protein
MARDYMAALLVLSGHQDRIEARTKLLESIGKDAVIDVVNNCFKLGVSGEALAQIASLALDDCATPSSGAMVSRSSTIATGASKSNHERMITQLTEIHRQEDCCKTSQEDVSPAEVTVA